MTRYEQGFLTKCAEGGLSDAEAKALLQQMALTQGADLEEDSPENDYKSGIGDMIRGIYKKNKTMAHKQRRFERDFSDKSGLRKILMSIKHPYRAAQAEGISGGKPYIAALIAGALAAQGARQATKPPVERKA